MPSNAQSDQATDQNDVPVPAGVDGADLVEQDDCPACGEKAQYLVEKAGYYECAHCLSVWAGDRDNADIVIYMNPESSPDKRLVTDGGESATTTAHSDGEMVVAEVNGTAVESDWQTMKRLANQILQECENHKTDLQKAEEINGAHIRISCDCCGIEQEYEWARDVRDRGQTPEEHADHPDFDCTPDDVTVEAFCPRHGTIPLAWDECDGCADARQWMNR